MVIEIGVLFAVATMLCWGTSDFLAKKAIDKVGYAAALLASQAIAIGPIIFYAVSSSPLPVLSFNLVLLALVAGVMGLLGYFYLYKGFKKGRLSVVSPISSSWFVITILIAATVFAETLTFLHVIGIIVVFTGVFLISTTLSEFRRSIAQCKTNGVIDALISMGAWGVAFALIKPIVGIAGPVMALMFTRVVSFSSMFLWVKATKIQISIPTTFIFIFIVLSGLLDALGLASYNLGVSTEFVSIVSPVAAAYPAVSILLARFFLKEQLILNQKIGVAAILTGLALVAII